MRRLIGVLLGKYGCFIRHAWGVCRASKVGYSDAGVARLVQVAGQGVGDAPVNGDFVGHAGVAPDGEVFDAEDGAREGVQQLILLRDQHRQHPGVVMPAVAPAADSVGRRMQP